MTTLHVAWDIVENEHALGLGYLASNMVRACLTCSRSMTSTLLVYMAYALIRVSALLPCNSRATSRAVSFTAVSIRSLSSVKEKGKLSVEF